MFVYYFKRGTGLFTHGMLQTEPQYVVALRMYFFVAPVIRNLIPSSSRDRGKERKLERVTALHFNSFITLIYPEDIRCCRYNVVRLTVERKLPERLFSSPS